MQVRILSRADIRQAVGMAEAIEAMASAFGQLSGGLARVPVRLAVETDKGASLFMPGHLQGSNVLGAKVVSVFDGNRARGLPAIHALVLLLDPETGAPTAILEGGWLTALRTGAASGLATRLLARPEASVVALFGAGVQARTQLEAVRAVRPVREVRIVSRSGRSAQSLASELEGVTAMALADPTAAVRGADIVITATSSSSRVVPGSAIEPGTHINAIGAYTTEMRELDSELVARARVVVDDRDAALAEAGDLVVPLREGVLLPDALDTELGDLVNATRPARRTAEEITLFKSVGSAAQDLAVAQRALEVAESRGLGTVLRL